MTGDERSAKLEALGQWVLEQSREYDIDGGDVQDKLIELGLLAYVTAAEPCGDHCKCLEYSDEFPTQCLREVEVKL